MAVGQAIPAMPLQIPIELVDGFVVDFDARAALAADQVVMRVLRNLIDKVLLRVQSRLDKAVAGQELEGAIDRGLSQAAETAAGSPENMRRREVRTGFKQYMQDRESLGCNAKSQ